MLTIMTNQVHVACWQSTLAAVAFVACGSEDPLWFSDYWVVHVGEMLREMECSREGLELKAFETAFDEDLEFYWE